VGAGVDGAARPPLKSMRPLDLTPHWDSSSTRICLGLLLVMLVMSAIALGLRWRANSERQHAFAADFGRRTLGWWLLVLLFVPGTLAGGVATVAVYTALVTWIEFTRIAGRAALRDAELTWASLLVGLHFVAVTGRFPLDVWRVDLTALAIIALSTLRGVRLDAWKPVGWRALGFVLCVMLMSVTVALALQFGTAALLFALVIVQAGDVLQYVAGKAFGRTPLAPRLSPKKTWEGLVGGIVGTALLGVALAPMIARGRGEAAALGAAVGIAGSLSGLAMSAVKRAHGAKDFGAWLPGHGGLLDRGDSLCGAAVVVYAWLAR
jgi:phosphatidate cytidylyltransferase